MASCNFHYNPLLQSMTYVGETLTLVLKEKGVKLKTWVYAPVPIDIAYELFYTKSGNAAVTCYNQKIKGIFKVIETRNSR